VVFEVVNCGKENFDMKNKFLGHLDCFLVLPATDLPEHIRYTSSTRLFKCGQDTSGNVYYADKKYGYVYSRPDSINLLFHPDLLVLQRHIVFRAFFFDVAGYF
jgi:hypothetical protein